MKKLMMAVALSLALCSLAHADNSQQTRMKTCNASAREKHLAGADRKTFMQECLSGGEAAAGTRNSQQEKRKKCNADAKTKGLTGDERKKFMSSCLSN